MSMPDRPFWLRLWVGCLSIWLAVGVLSPPAWAAIDPYVIRYLRVTEPIPLAMDEQGQTQLFSAEALSAGKNSLNRIASTATLEAQRYLTQRCLSP